MRSFTFWTWRSGLLARTLQPRSRRLHMYAVHERIRKKKESQVIHDFQRRPSLTPPPINKSVGHSAPFDRLARPHGRWPHDDIKSKYDLAYQPSRLRLASAGALSDFGKKAGTQNAVVFCSYGVVHTSVCKVTTDRLTCARADPLD